MTEKQFNHKMRQAELKNVEIERKKQIREVKRKYALKIKKPETSKILLFAIFILCVQIIFFVEHMIKMTGDFSSIYALIGLPVTLVPTIWAYYSKSKAENTAGGIVYDMAMAQYQSSVENTGTVENTSEV